MLVSPSEQVLLISARSALRSASRAQLSGMELCKLCEESSYDRWQNGASLVHPFILCCDSSHEKPRSLFLLSWCPPHLQMKGSLVWEYIRIQQIVCVMTTAGRDKTNIFLSSLAICRLRVLVELPFVLWGRRKPPVDLSPPSNSNLTVAVTPSKLKEAKPSGNKQYFFQVENFNIPFSWCNGLADL